MATMATMATAPPAPPCDSDIAAAAYARWQASLDGRDALHNWLNAERALRLASLALPVPPPLPPPLPPPPLPPLPTRAPAAKERAERQRHETIGQDESWRVLCPLDVRVTLDSNADAYIDGVDVHVAARASEQTRALARAATERVVAFLSEQPPRDRWLALVQSVDGAQPNTAFNPRRIHAAYWVVHDETSPPLVVAAWLFCADSSNYAVRSRVRMRAFVDDYMRPLKGSQAVYGAALQSTLRSQGAAIYSFRPYVISRPEHS